MINIASPLLTGLALVGVSAALFAQTPEAKTPVVRTQLAASPSARPSEGGRRLREGTKLIEVEGRFEFTGDRMAFFRADAEESYKVLENLALERINKVLEETRANEKPQWMISGIVTEYHGGNFLLVTKAVIKAQEAPALRSGQTPANVDANETGAKP